MLFLYLIIIIVFFLILFKLYVKIKYKFWAYQPVFHYYNLLYWINPKGIINDDLPETNKYCNFLNITTTSFEERDENTIKEIVGFIQRYYYRNSNINYSPTNSSFSSHFIGNNSKTFISTYYKPIIQINVKDYSQVNNTELVGIMTTKPINITFKNMKTFIGYYVDYLCVHNEYRKMNIAPEIIQTHEYIQRHNDKKIKVSLFKREGELTGIVALTTYLTYQFSISSISKYTLLHPSMKLIEINKLNLNLLITFIYNQRNKFECYALPDITNLLTLINNEIYKIYAIIENDKLISCYFLRDTHMYYNDNKAVECFASISNCPHNEIFINGFIKALQKYSKKIKATLITIENISHNNIIINYIFSLNILSKIESPTAYFFYNYAKRPILSEKVMLIC